MNRITIITASAGSGKTTRLARALEEAVVTGSARPDAVLATTFTRKAAAELQERARKALLEAGRPDDAHRLVASRIGTVNAVCGRLVGEFAFELGLSPELGVIDETLAEHTLARAISTAVPAEVQDELTALERRMPHLAWRASVRAIIEAARQNRIDPEEFSRCAERSTEGFSKLLGRPAPDGEAIDRDFAQALETFLGQVDLEHDGTGTTRKYVRRARAALAKLKSGARPPWLEWIALSQGPGAKSRDVAEPVKRAASFQDAHPGLHEDVERAIALVFEAAALSLRAYQLRKRRWGALDFVDQEVHALDLLQRAEVRARLAEELDLVLIDEFQDTSPLQLAIFLELARLAPQSIWVGDQKQAIYGFRGTDPALMTAAMEDLLGENDPELVQSAVESLVSVGETETLDTSYRSRPELVRLTSDVFAGAFAAHGLPEDRVRLSPRDSEEPAGLGPIVEHWPLELTTRSKNVEGADALAAAIRDLLTREDERVRSRENDAPRPIRPSDVAVLCRTNQQCADVAAALARLDLRAVVPRTGLLETPEGRVAVAALRLWVDPRDRLAAAILSRFIDHPEDGDAWLREVLSSQEGPSTVVETDAARRIRTARAGHPGAGAVEALERAIEAADLASLCLGWGESEARLANLDRLRAHAVTYRAECRARSASPTPVGFLAYLADLADDRGEKHPEDHQAVRATERAVVVTTWHGAKGLEWPVTVLYGLEKHRTADALGPRVVSDRTDFDLTDPLGGRWIRFWPTPYWGIPKKSRFTERLETHDATGRARERADREALRVLYVGWTRARDRLVLSAERGKLLGGILGKLTALGEDLFHAPAADGAATWAGRSLVAAVHPSRAAAPIEPSVEPGLAYPARERRAHPPATVTASSLEGSGKVGAPIRLGDRIPLRGEPDMTRLGQAVHAFFAADSKAGEPEERRALAASLLARWEVASHLDPDHLLQAADALERWIDATWPSALAYAEWPVGRRLSGGTRHHGIADLVLELEKNVVIVDHKAFPGAVAEATRRAESHAGQLAAYADAVGLALGKPLTACFIHLPLSAVVVPVKPTRAD